MATTTKQDYYELLGVPRKAGAKDIRAAFRKLARKYHPDLNPGDKSAEEKFKHLQEAYDVLSDPKKRQMYDERGFYSDNFNPGAAPPRGGGGGESDVNFDFGGFDFGGGGAEGAGGGNFRDLFSQFFRGGRGTAMEPEQEVGGDLEYQIEIDFWDAVRGAVKKLQITRLDICETCHGTGAIGSPQTCPVCNGSGTIQQAAGKMRFNVPCTRCGGTGKTRTPCRTCGGEGRVRKTETIEVRIPPGVASGARLRVPAKGNAGTMGAPAGDLYLRVEVRPHPFFERRGNDLYTKVPVTVSEATLGAKIEVPTIDGRSLVRIPPGTNCGSTLRLREKGVPDTRTGTRGDQYAEIQVVVPKPTDERVRKLMKELEAVEPGDPRKDLFTKAGV
ncbi:MAG: heat shock protein DnaJ domain protein [Candidatus Acidoferrum typicum]|nr:heat shock protein DnaJ domain protein [Candidatus Acidoferrum typicum]